MAVVNPLWVEKYRPKTIDDCILPQALKDQLKGIIKTGDMPNLLFSGGAGVGKTTVARAICTQLGFEYLVINGSDEGRLIDTLRTKITQFASTVSMDDTRKVVILDEADYMGNDIQAALRGFTENFSANCGFILTCNYPNRLIEPLRSRCSVVAFDIPKSDKVNLATQFLHRVEFILNENKIKFDKKVVAEVIMKYFPDWRRVLNEMQRYSKSGKIDSSAVKNFAETDLKELVGYLKDKNFKLLRSWVGSSPTLEISGLCRNLYEQADIIFKPGSIPYVVLIMAKYQYQSAFVSDLEICIVAMLTELMSECEFL